MVAVIFCFREAEKKIPKMLCSTCPPSLLSPVMGAILRDEPLCSGLSSVLTLRGYCHSEVGSGQIPRERVGKCAGREIDRDRGADRKRENTGQTDRESNKEKTESNLGVSQNKGDSVGRAK